MDRAAFGYLAMSKVPSLPASVPEKAKDYGPEELERWIKDYYAASAFNICEHQPLQAMTGPPLKINIEKGAKPVALHQPMPLPHHWRQDVLRGHQRDCRLGVIRRVPAGTPTTW